MSRMYKTVTKTWNPFKGCLFDCIYCWARRKAEGRLRRFDKYRDGFNPALFEKDLEWSFNPGSFVAVSLMGDAYWMKDQWRDAILGRVSQFPLTDFLFQSKDPSIFGEWPKWPNIIYATTIETNRNYQLTKAPEPYERYLSMVRLKHPHKFISIEPVCDFDLDVLLHWVDEIRPEIIEVGADNHHNNLPEPHWWKVEALLENLRTICHRVIEKDGLDRLKCEKNAHYTSALAPGS